jgi:hypothetical protein
MVQIDNKKREIKIAFFGDVSDLTNMQTALMELMRHYNFKDFGNGADETFYFALNLLQALTPDTDQQENGLINKSDFMLIPEGITEKQKEQLRYAMLEVSNPGALKNPQKNPIIEALRNIEK